MTEIKWKLPGHDEPGYLRRRRDLIALLDAEPSPENMDKMIEFLLPFIEQPKSRKAKENALLDASKAEYGKAVLEILGYGVSVPDPKGVKSGPQ
jgi:hypothetical protein